MARNKLAKPDSWLLGICFGILFFGIVILASVSASFSLEQRGTAFYYLLHQLLIGLLPGLLAAGVIFFLPTSVIKKYTAHAFFASIGLILLVFVPGIGLEAGGAHRWLYFAGFTFQPAELLKLTFILYLALWLVPRAKTKQPAKKSILSFIKNNSVFFAFLSIMTGIGILMILQPDVGTLGILWIIGGIMYFASGTPLWHSITMLTLGIGALGIMIRMAPYRLSRIAVFFDPSLDPLGQGYHMKQALMGIGSGGIFGTGLGLSIQKFGILPEPMSDSIFAIIAEETGFVGSLLLIFLFIVLAWRALILTKKTGDPFTKVASIGIVSWICVQAFVNMGAITGILPLTGIPLPFVSYGGSALLIEAAALGVLLNLTKS